ncbi:MAG: DUF4126 domain-containing protein [Elusimicrobiota bacterium]
MEAVLGILTGIGLAAACGFRVFVPMLVMGIAARTGALELTSGFAWLSGDAALICLGAATLVEIISFYIPWLDNLLDTIASPAAVLAGTIVTAGAVGDLQPWLKWSLALIAGGGAAAAVQALTASSRAGSAITTAGLGNPIIATIEAAASIILSALAIFIPVIAAVVVLCLFLFIGKRLYRRLKPAT